MTVESLQPTIALPVGKDSVFGLLFEAAQNTSPLYDGVLANHLPMTLIAMQRLGASDKQMCQFYNDYIEKLEPIKKTECDDQLLQQFKMNGIQQTLLDFLGVYAHGISASAFHGLIRLGYAVMTEDRKEIAIALTYFKNESQSLGCFASSQSSNSAHTSTDLTSIVEKIRNTPTLFEQIIPAPNIIVRLQKVSEIDDFTAIVSACSLLRTDLSELTRFTLALYMATQDFTALHGMTSCHALQTILNYLHQNSDQQPPSYHRRLQEIEVLLIRYYTLSLSAAYISIGTPSFDIAAIKMPSRLKSNDKSKPDWQSLAETALNGGDDHDIKFLFTCIEQSQFTHINAFYNCAQQQFSKN